MKLNVLPYVVFTLLTMFLPLSVIIFSFTVLGFWNVSENASKASLLMYLVVGALALFVTMTVVLYFLQPARIYLELMEARGIKTSATDSMNKTKHLRNKYFRLSMVVAARLLSKLVPFIIPTFVYAARVSLWPYYLVDKNPPNNKALEMAVIASDTEAVHLAGKQIIFGSGWWLAQEYIDRQKI